jgi:pilus assembly protein Flp/PilA
LLAAKVTIFCNHGWVVSMSIFKSLIRDTRGATVIEYALIATLISIVIFAGALAIGNSLSNTFGSVGSDL